MKKKFWLNAVFSIYGHVFSQRVLLGESYFATKKIIKELKENTNENSELKEFNNSFELELIKMKLGPNYSRGNKDIEKDLDESQLTKILIEKKRK